jgi:N-acetylglucosamine-6-phosphate deacetylase
MSRHTITGRNPQNGRPLAIIVYDGLIREIQDGRRDEYVWLSPGLVDLQVNGYGGDDGSFAGG